MSGQCEGTLIHLETDVTNQRDCQERTQQYFVVTGGKDESTWYYQSKAKIFIVSLQSICKNFSGCNYYTFSAVDQLCELFETCPTTSEEFCSTGCVSSRPGCEVETK